ncbi:hypothetical protein LCGC14_0568150 [marine sediment metagenome]|uniref:Uncharacterized protein n=1 Tax=marine sediment metagenome TaxID=412755 RepID=A0A0F9UT88_9ZZZZ
MPTPIVTIDDFSQGTQSDITKNRGFQMMYGSDIHRNPGVLRAAYKTEQGGVDTVLTTNSEYIKDFELYVYDNAIGQINLHGVGSNTGIYRLDPADDTWKRDHTAGAILGDTIKSFATSMYYVNGASLGRLNGDPTVGGNWTDAYKGLPFLTTGQNPMVVFASSLYIGVNRYISKLEADEVNYDATALTLSADSMVVDMTVWNDFIVISIAKKHRVLANVTGNEGFVAFWDGVSEFPSAIVTTDGPLYGLTNYNNRLIGVSKGRIFAYNGSDFEIQKRIPGVHNTSDNLPSTVSTSVLYRENVLFALEPPQDSAGSVKTKGGVWEFGRNSVEFPLAVSHAYEPRTGEYGQSDLLKMGGLFVFPSDFGTDSFWKPLDPATKILFSYYDAENSTYNVDQVTIDEGYANSAYAVTSPFEISHREDPRLVKGVKLEFAEAMNVDDAINKVTVKYRLDSDIDYLDDTSNWTTLGIIDNDPAANDNMNEILYGVYEKAFKMQMRFDLTASGAGAEETIGLTRIHIY